MRLQLKRGTAAKAAAYVGPPGEIVVDRQNFNFHLADGINPGGSIVGANTFPIGVPSILSPIPEGDVFAQPFTIVASAFAGSGLHHASYWEITDDSDFSSVLESSGWSSDDLLSYTPLAAIAGPFPKTLYARVKHRGIHGNTVYDSLWSPVVMFAVLAD